jgi:hypothetical protein
MPRQHVHDLHRAALAIVMLAGFESKRAALLLLRSRTKTHFQAQSRFGRAI